jgi:hypothetical protein
MGNRARELGINRIMPGFFEEFLLELEVFVCGLEGGILFF